MANYNITYGEFKQIVLNKLDMTEEEANVYNFVNRFTEYFNEAMTQICSSIKHNHEIAHILVYPDMVGKMQDVRKYLKAEFISFAFAPSYWGKYFPLYEPLPLDVALQNDWIREFEKSAKWQEFIRSVNITWAQFFDSLSVAQRDYFYRNPVIENSFKVCKIGYDQKRRHLIENFSCLHEVDNEDVIYHAYYNFIPLHTMILALNCHVIWEKLSASTPDNYIIQAPSDILYPIATYIASQCWRVNDETKSARLMNEYELQLSRIDNTSFDDIVGVKIKGGW